MCERILAQNCQKFDNFNFEFSMSHHNARYQSYKNAPQEQKHFHDHLLVENLVLLQKIIAQDEFL